MLKEKVVELTNVEREKAGLQPLKINNQLANAVIVDVKVTSNHL